MKKAKGTKKKKTQSASMMKIIKEQNDMFIISAENWNTQDNRTLIMNADFRQMNSARDKR